MLLPSPLQVDLSATTAGPGAYITNLTIREAREEQTLSSLTTINNPRNVHRTSTAPAMGARPQLITCKVEESIPARPARLHGGHDQEGARTVIQDGTQAANARGDGHAQDEEGVGSRNWPR